MGSRQKIFGVISTFLLSMAVSGTAWAATYYVATNGSDSNNGSQAAPWRTIAHGSQKMAGGDTLYIRAGTYNEGIGTSAKIPNGTPSSYTRFAAAPGNEGKAILMPSGGDFVVFFSRHASYIEVSNLVLDETNVVSTGVRFDSSSDEKEYAKNNRLIKNEIRNGRQGMVGGGGNEIIGNHIHHVRGYCAYLNKDNGIYVGNICHDAGGYGIHLYSSFHEINGWVLRNNVIFNVGSGFQKKGNDGTYHWGIAPAVILARGSNQFYNNIVYNNPHGGIQIGLGARDVFVANNTVYGNGEYGILIDSAYSGSKNTKVINNISYGNSGTQIIDKGTGTILKNNLTTDPKFVNAGSGDFGLQAGSPAIDKGMTMAEVKTDFTGKARPEGAAYDIGAFEGAGSRANVLPGMGGGLPLGGGGISSPPLLLGPNGEVCYTGY